MLHCWRCATCPYGSHCLLHMPCWLAGSCNHIAGLLYALEDFVRLGLREEAAKTCTEKLMQWNHPRAATVKASRVTEVHLKKDMYSGRDLGEKKKSIPFYDPGLQTADLSTLRQLPGCVMTWSALRRKLWQRTNRERSRCMAAHVG